MQTVFTSTSGVRRLLAHDSNFEYYPDNGKIERTLGRTSGEQIPVGAVITNVTINFENSIRTAESYYNGYVKETFGMKLTLNGYDVTQAYWYWSNGGTAIPNGSLLTTSAAYAGLDSISFFLGWEKTVWDSWTGYVATFDANVIITLTVTWDPVDDFTVTSSVVAGNSCTISIDTSSYSHQYNIVFGNTSTGYVAMSGSSASVIIPISWISQIPNSTSGTATAYLKTLSGSTELGIKSHTFTITVPSGYGPVLSSGEINVASATQFEGNYIQNKTTIAPSVTATPQYSATLSSATIKLNGNSFTAASISNTSITSQQTLLTGYGTMSVVITVTDSRGRSSSVTLPSFSVVQYSTPQISIIKCNRYNPTTGADDVLGTAIRVQASSTYTSVGSNTTTINVVTTGINQTIAENTATTLGSDGSFPTTNAYTVTFTVTDSVGYSSSTVREIGTGAYKFFLKKDGTGAAFGKANEYSNALEIPSSWNIYKGSTMYENVIVRYSSSQPSSPVE